MTYYLSTTFLKTLPSYYRQQLLTRIDHDVRFTRHAPLQPLPPIAHVFSCTALQALGGEVHYIFVLVPQ
jgi:hypothetical protein